MKEVPESEVIEPSSPDPDVQQQITFLQIQAQVGVKIIYPVDLHEIFTIVERICLALAEFYAD